MEYRTSIELNPDVYRQLAKIINQSDPYAAAFGKGLVIIFTLAAIAAWVLFHQLDDIELVVTAVGCFLAGFVSIIILAITLNQVFGNQQIRELKPVQMQLVINQQGIDFKVPHRNGHFDWEAVLKLIQSEKYWIIRLETLNNYVALETHQMTRELSHFIEHQCQVHNIPIQPIGSTH